MGGTNLPRRQCFCKYGFHGEACAYRNEADLPRPTHSLNLTAHALQVLSERMLMYYRVSKTKTFPNNIQIDFQKTEFKICVVVNSSIT
jgi:hypothetical protein